MKRHIRPLLVICVLLPLSAVAQNSDKTQSTAIPLEMRIDPENLAPLVLDQKIRFMMHDGTYGEGRVVRASQSDLTLRVKKSEPKGRLARPEAVVQLAGISVIHMKKGGNVAAPITLGILGGIGGFTAGAFAGVSCCDEHPGMILLPLTASIGGSVGGSLLGREMVRKTVTIYLNHRNSAVTP
ncbi:MAG: hypothetical protein L0387_41275 [Acidobacteria bacterium]|nr:hypothetical protein [Acidobacteriota bacterium]MCI0628021.1 hypothetical protein [Acidobacteriota bacterium]MCI0724678.1 hypothetical protein [Acidobacteriota bacterium]